VDPALYRSLSSAFEFASQHVAHFSFNRVLTEESAGVDYLDAARLRSRAEDVFGAMAAFIRYMYANEGAYGGHFEQLLSEAKGRDC
jgi:superoxide dismutase